MERESLSTRWYARAESAYKEQLAIGAWQSASAPGRSRPDSSTRAPRQGLYLRYPDFRDYRMSLRWASGEKRFGEAIDVEI
jgi:hypothetical protein